MYLVRHPDAPTVLPTCRVCVREVYPGDGLACGTCEDYTVHEVTVSYFSRYGQHGNAPLRIRHAVDEGTLFDTAQTLRPLTHPSSVIFCRASCLTRDNFGSVADVRL